jgi:hypothetical protein
MTLISNESILARIANNRERIPTVGLSSELLEQAMNLKTSPKVPKGALGILRCNNFSWMKNNLSFGIYHREDGSHCIIGFPNNGACPRYYDEVYVNKFKFIK